MNLTSKTVNKENRSGEVQRDYGWQLVVKWSDGTYSDEQVSSFTRNQEDKTVETECIKRHINIYIGDIIAYNEVTTEDAAKSDRMVENLRFIAESLEKAYSRLMEI